MIRYGFAASHSDLAGIVPVLQAMSRFFEASCGEETAAQLEEGDEGAPVRGRQQQQQHAVPSPFDYEVATRYSAEEESWAQSCLSRVRRSYDAVPFGAGIVEVYAQYNMGVPFSKVRGNCYIRRQLAFQRRRGIFPRLAFYVGIPARDLTRLG